MQTSKSRRRTWLWHWFVIDTHIVHLGQFITIGYVFACRQKWCCLIYVRAIVVRQTRNKDTNAMLCELRNVKGTCIFSISIHRDRLQWYPKRINKKETKHTPDRTSRLINRFGRDTQPFHLILSSWSCTEVHIRFIRIFHLIQLKYTLSVSSIKYICWWLIIGLLCLHKFGLMPIKMDLFGTHVNSHMNKKKKRRRQPFNLYMYDIDKNNFQTHFQCMSVCDNGLIKHKWLPTQINYVMNACAKDRIDSDLLRTRAGINGTSDKHINYFQAIYFLRWQQNAFKTIQKFVFTHLWTFDHYIALSNLDQS